MIISIYILHLIYYTLKSLLIYTIYILNIIPAKKMLFFGKLLFYFIIIIFLLLFCVLIKVDMRSRRDNENEKYILLLY